MSLLSMPFLIINLGGEMIYILEQRLQAQNIPTEKSAKVLQDVTRAMLNPKFVVELFKPQELYAHTSTREIYDRLAHSSIMRLSESSMDKLYDLMCMGAKYQLVSVRAPQEILTVTLNHLESIRKIVESSEEVAGLVDSVSTQLVDTYKDMDSGEFSLIRQSLLSFFQDKKVKVSLFLQDGLQNTDGTIVLTAATTLPPTFEVPGTVRYYDDQGSQTKSAAISHPNATGVSVTSDKGPALSSTLGCNLYSASRGSKSKPSTSAAVQAALARPAAKEPAKRPVSASAELNFLADLLGAQKKAEPTAFKLNLFPESEEAESQGAGGIISIKVDATKSAMETNKDLANIISGLKIEESNPSASSGDDLLDLMDSAS